MKNGDLGGSERARTWREIAKGPIGGATSLTIGGAGVIIAAFQFYATVMANTHLGIQEAETRITARIERQNTHLTAEIQKNRTYYESLSQSNAQQWITQTSRIQKLEDEGDKVQMMRGTLETVMRLIGDHTNEMIQIRRVLDVQEGADRELRETFSSYVDARTQDRFTSKDWAREDRRIEQRLRMIEGQLDQCLPGRGGG